MLSSRINHSPDTLSMCCDPSSTSVFFFSFSVVNNAIKIHFFSSSSLCYWTGVVKDLGKTGISWDEVEEVAEDRKSGWNRVAQCVFDAGWTTEPGTSVKEVMFSPLCFRLLAGYLWKFWTYFDEIFRRGGMRGWDVLQATNDKISVMIPGFRITSGI